MALSRFKNSNTASQRIPTTLFEACTKAVAESFGTLTFVQCVKERAKWRETVCSEENRLCQKLALVRTECAHNCTSRVVVGWVDCPTCQVLGHSMNSNCGAVGTVDCEHHGRRIHKNWYSTD